ncbi:SDR family oxidoreductase [Nonomuraea sp. 10N515B]|uniref:SDR family oxidoreductase n=1 Tax=Nonomuraea sp. 10N515B TaxID=3457422 RepID=UPI003FCC9B07
MRIAVAGATGNIGSLTVAALEEGGHDVVRISRSHGVDLSTGDGLDDALTGVEAVVDATNMAATERAEAVASFGAVTRNLLTAEERLGVRHHVLLSIVGLHRVEGNPRYAGKREQERLVAAGPVPWTIAPADVAGVLAEIATGEPKGRYVDVAGPEPQDLVDMARRTNEARGREVKLVPTWSGPLGAGMAGDVLLPGENARIAPTTFDEWLAGQR